jgi:hypothetical protein
MAANLIPPSLAEIIIARTREAGGTMPVDVAAEYEREMSRLRLMPPDGSNGQG